MNNKEQHNKEHQNWSRRQFLTTGGLAAAGSLFLGNTTVSAFAPNKMMAALNTANSDRILVLIYLFGGNDHLNTIIPYSVDVGKDFYLNGRPELKQVYNQHYSDNHLLSGFGDTNFALNQNMESLMDFWNNDSMHVIHKVGYPNANLSHFISQLHWFSGTDNKVDPNYNSGWMGRSLDQLYPAYLDTPPTVPIAMNIGSNGGGRTFVNSQNTAMSLPISNPGQFYGWAQQGQFYSTEGLGNCAYDHQKGFLRRTVNNALSYSSTIFDAYNASENMATVNYPSNSLATNLNIVARLIKGGLGTKIYSVGYGGFDTHSNQKNVHANLLADIANAISSFHQDLATTGQDERVVSFPFSEFGRTLKENGSGSAAGTDHGTVADFMLFGKGVNGGFSGTPIDFEGEDVTATGGWRATFEAQEGSIDFRSIYATLLQDWLCIDGLVVDYALGNYYPRIPNLIADPCESNRDENPDVLLGHRINPKAGNSMEIRYGIFSPGPVKFEILNSDGQHLATLINEHHAPGTYTIKLAPPKYYFAPGTYLYKMSFGGKEYLRKLEL